MTQQSIGMIERGRTATQQSELEKREVEGQGLIAQLRGQNERINTTISQNWTQEVMCF